MKHKPVRQSSFYKVEKEGLTRTKRTCPRCGEATWMARHSDRWTCGRCGYTEFAKTSTRPSTRPTRP